MQENTVCFSFFDNVYFSPEPIEISRQAVALWDCLNRPASTSAIFLGALIFLCQIGDGLLTYEGIGSFGVELEGNMLMRQLMEFCGIALTIVFAKSISVMLGVTLAYWARKSQLFLLPMLAMVSAYLTFALLPWAMIIYNETI